MPTLTAPPKPALPRLSRFQWPWRWPVICALSGVALSLGFTVSLLVQEQQVLSSFLNRESDSCQWVVFLKNGAESSLLGEKLRSLPGLRDMNFVTKNQAMERAKSDPVLVEGLALVLRNPFPESYEVRWNTSWLRPDFLTPLAKQVETWDGVDRVTFDVSRVERVAVLSRLAAQRRTALAGILWGLVVVMVFLSARTLFYSRFVRWRDVLWAPLVGAAAGALGAGTVRLWLGEYSFEGVGAGALLGLLAVLGRTVADE